MSRLEFVLIVLLGGVCFVGALVFLLTHNVDQTYDLPPETHE